MAKTVIGVAALVAMLLLGRPSLGRTQTLERGLPPCSDEAVAAAKAGAEKEQPAALYQLARYYSTGKCVQSDGPEAVRLYQRAADLGYAPAFYNLGVIAGGGRQDFVGAESDFLRGAALGHRGCELMLGILYATTPPVADNIKAYGWLSLGLSRTPPLDVKTAQELLKGVRERLAPEDLQRANGYLAKLQAQYGPIPAFQP